LKKIVFTSGLPRSGSTLLSAILNQNPRFESDITSPICSVMDSIKKVFSQNSENTQDLAPEKIDNIFKNILEGYHNTSGKDVFFNNSRGWTAKSDILERIYPNYKMIITVRDIGWILDSYELIYKKNIYKKPIYYWDDYRTVYDRCESVMGAMCNSYKSLKEFLYSNKNNGILIEYDLLVSEPEMVMRSIYQHIEEPYFNHDFNNVMGKNYTPFDNDINMPGIHDIKKIVKQYNRKTVIPPDIWERYSGLEIWKNLKS
jgi:sulfotransferase